MAAVQTADHYCRCNGEELAGLPIEHIEEAVLVCLKQNLSEPGDGLLVYFA
jgi:hypothetical protein